MSRRPVGLRGFARRNRWLWAGASVLLLWAVLALLTGRFSLQSLSGVGMSAAFLAIAALGQMFVITTGRGNIDLSIGSVMALSAFIGLIVVHGSDANLLPGLAAVAAVGLCVGGVNAVLVVLCRIPAIIATLATGYVLATATLLANRIGAGFVVSPLLLIVVAGRIGGVPIMVIVALAAVAIAALVLDHTAYGRTISAVGQNIRAARLAGVATGRVVAGAFLTSAMLAAFDGALLGAHVGGAFLDMGTPYLLQSLGAVILGGSLIMGGASSALGTLFGSILLVLIVTTMQIAGLPPGTQDIVQGLVIVAVLALAGGIGLRTARSTAPRPGRR
jgi:ribose transport system permease protein